MLSKRYSISSLLVGLMIGFFWASFASANSLSQSSLSTASPPLNPPLRPPQVLTQTRPLSTATLLQIPRIPSPVLQPALQTLRYPNSYPFNSYGSGDAFLPPYLSESERLGFGRAEPRDEARLNAGWYINWNANINPSHPAGADYVPTIILRVRDTGIICGSAPKPATQFSQITPTYTGTSLINNVSANPGAVWLIGNEPDGIFNRNPIQAELYAELYHYFYTTIKATDPTAKVAIGAVIQPSPLRLKYLDRILNHYQATYGTPLPLDIWNIHFYILPETECQAGASLPPFIEDDGSAWLVDFTPQAMLNLSAMEANLRDFRTWMYNRGYGHKPLIITEYGVLIGPEHAPSFTNEVAANFLHNMSTLFQYATDPVTGYSADGNRLVQKWAWFSTHDVNFGGDLFHADSDDLTIIGEAFVEEINARYTPYIDLRPIPPTTIFSTTDTLWAEAYLQNRGNTGLDHPQVRLTLIDARDGKNATEALINLAPIPRQYEAPPHLISHTWTVSYAQLPTMTVPYTLVVAVASPDANPANDALIIPVDWWPFIDLTVSNISVEGGSIFAFEGEKNITINVTVSNIGSRSVSGGTLQFSGQGVSSGSALFPPISASIPELAPSANYIISTTLTLTQSGTYTIETLITAFSDDAAEITSNNRSSRLILALAPQQYLPLIIK